jgi:Protein of unknown function (DUF742)
MDSEDDRWTEWDAGPVSRPYTVTGGRTHLRGTWHFDLVDVVVRTPKSADTTFLSPERSRILDLCRVPTAVAELASAVGLPIGVVRVLLDDLMYENLIEVKAAAPRGRVTDMELLRQVLHGLQSL